MRPLFFRVGMPTPPNRFGALRRPRNGNQALALVSVALDLTDKESIKANTWDIGPLWERVIRQACG